MSLSSKIVPEFVIQILACFEMRHKSQRTAPIDIRNTY